MTELKSLLFSHEARQQANLTSLSTSMANLTVQSSETANSGSDSSFPSALYAGNRPNYNPNSNNTRRGGGNSRGNYRGRGRGRSSSSSSSDSIQCQICNKWGHSVVKCYHRFNIAYNVNSSPSSSSSPTSTPSNPQALLAEPSSSPSQDWFLDSSASTHITNDLNALSSAVVYSGPDKVHIGNGASLSISHTGSSLIHSSNYTIKLNNVLCVPSITKNLLSISQLLKDNNVLVEFTDSHCFVKDKITHLTILYGSIHDSLYLLHLPTQSPFALSATKSSVDV